MKMAKSVVDNTAPCGRPDGVGFGMEKASVKLTVKERSVRNALRMKMRYVGSLKEINLYKSPLIQTVS
jgi:hypothetical protein